MVTALPHEKWDQIWCWSLKTSLSARLHVLQSAQFCGNACETLARPGIRRVTFVGHIQEFNQYYTTHKTKCSFAVAANQHRFSHAGGLKPCILDQLQSPSENNQLLSKSTEIPPLKKNLPMACNSFASWYSVHVYIGFLLVGYEQNRNHPPN